MTGCTLLCLDEFSVFCLPKFCRIAENCGFIADFCLFIKLLRCIVARESGIKEHIAALDAKVLQLLDWRSVRQCGTWLEDGHALEGCSLGQRVV